MWHFNFESRRSTLTAFALSLLLPSAVLGSESAVRTFPDGTPSDRRHPQAPPIKLAADDWIYLKLPRPGAAYEALASSPNGVVLFRNLKDGSYHRWRIGEMTELKPDQSSWRLPALLDKGPVPDGSDLVSLKLNNYVVNASGGIGLAYVTKRQGPDVDWEDEYIHYWPSVTPAPITIQGELYLKEVEWEGGIFRTVKRHSRLLTADNFGFIFGEFSRIEPRPTDVPFDSFYRYPSTGAGLSDASWFGSDFVLTVANDRGDHIGKRVGGNGTAISGVVGYANVTFAPVYISENGVVLGRNGLSNFSPLGSAGAQVLYSLADGVMPLPTGGRVMTVDEQDRPNGFSPGGTPVVWDPKRDSNGVPLVPKQYELKPYVPMPMPAGWSSTHLIAPGTTKHQLGIMTNAGTNQTLPFFAIRGGLRVDANRDGQIAADGSDSTSAANPFRFWVNDDDDDGDEANQTALGGNSDEPGKLSGWFEFDGRTPDHAKTGVDGRCDLIDFFPVYLDIKQLLTVLPHTSGGFTYKLKQADGRLNFVYTDLSRDHAFDYLTKESSVYGTNFNRLPHLAETLAIKAEGVTLSTTFLEEIKNGTGKGVILVEGKLATDRPLRLVIEKEGVEIAEVALNIKISEVEKMYRWVNLRGAAGQSEKRPTNISEPENYPDNRTNGKMFIWLHGYNVNEQQSRAWNAEAFKRLYQSGSRAMFSAVTWHGDHSQIPLIGVSPDYWENITNAFQTSAVLPAAVNALPGSSKIIVGHSMGNVVVTSAIKDHGLNVTKYFMLNAAVALEAYDASTLQVGAMRHPAWSNYNQRLWSTEWYKLFPQVDGRRGLTWINRFGDVANAINFYSSGEEVLNNNDAASGGTPGQVPTVGGERAWILQEMVKGTQHIGAALTFDSQGGWGFNVHWDIETQFSNVTRRDHLDPASAAALTDDELKTQPFFRRFQDSRLMGTGGNAVAGEYLNRAQILGGAIPAMSFPTGRNPVPLFDQQDRNADLMARQDGWPQARLSDPAKRLPDGRGRWFHSDAKNIAYRYNYPLWEEWVQRGSLK